MKFTSLFIPFASSIAVFAFTAVYIAGTFQLSNPISPELNFTSFSSLGTNNSRVVAASCGFTSNFLTNTLASGLGTSTQVSTAHGGADEYTTCTATCPSGVTVSGRSQCGGACEPTVTCPQGCPNGAINPPTCNQCPANTQMINGSCVCFNNGTVASGCNACPTGLVMENGLCECANGAGNPPACNVCPNGSNMVNGTCTCSNNATPRSNCTQCRAGQVMENGTCVPGCELTNVCGQTALGVMRNGQCVTVDGSNPNNSCIKLFSTTGDTINPNGSVEFAWSMEGLRRNVAAKCGFVDLTTPVARPIPGLQNLDPKIDRVRISNVQTTTRFCLICQFYSLIDNSSLGDAALHQWIRVIKIGEN